MGVNIRNSEGYMDTVPFQAISGIDREAKAASKPAFRPLVYICAPFSGDIEANKKKAAEFAEYACRNGCIPQTAHLLFPFMDDTNQAERDTAIHMDIVLMGKCQEVWVLKERITHGMSIEIDKANRRRQKVRYFNSRFEEVQE